MWQRDPFEFLARWCIAPVHAVLVRARRVREAGGFDEQLCSCEDWDLWQRIARAGASFATVPEVLARYNLRPDSMSSATGVMLEAGLCIIAQAHGPDPRVRSPSPANRNGRPSWQLPDARIELRDVGRRPRDRYRAGRRADPARGGRA